LALIAASTISLSTSAIASTSACQQIGPRFGAASAGNVSFAAYIGGGANDSINVAEVADNCLVYFGGTVSGNTLPNARVIGPGTTTKSSGVLVLSHPKTGVVTAAVRFGQSIRDAQLHRRSGDIIIASDAGLARLSADLTTIRWIKAGAFVRVSVGADGTIAALQGAGGKRLVVYNPNGTQSYERQFSDSMVNDVAVFSGSNAADRRIVVTGFAQRDGGGCRELQVAWLRAYNTANQLAWTGYDWTHAQAFNRSSSCADTRGYRVEVGRDNKLYFAGESAGGNSIFRYLARDLQRAAPNVASDAYNHAYNTASNHITYFSRLNPLDGTQTAGSFLLARLQSGRGNTIKPRAITADKHGNVYIGGFSAASIQNRSSLTLNGVLLAPYAGGDPWIMSVDPDFRQRRLWTSFADGGQGEVQAIGVGGNALAVGIRVDARNSTTGRAMYTTPGAAKQYSGAKAGYRAVLPAQ
jgi:hypothetical protein